jgi:hypothetical protein
MGDHRFDALLDFPWGVIVFLLLAIGGLIAVLFTPYEFKDYLPGIAGGSGLLGVGHGIRQVAKTRQGHAADAPRQ